MTTLEILTKAVVDAEKALKEAENALAEFQDRPENNVYESLEDAAELEEILEGLAFQDCEGSHNCGRPEYTREFMVGDKVYIATLKCEYNRHDKTYYYVDSTKFSIAEKA